MPYTTFDNNSLSSEVQHRLIAEMHARAEVEEKKFNAGDVEGASRAMEFLMCAQIAYATMTDKTESDHKQMYKAILFHSQISRKILPENAEREQCKVTYFLKALQLNKKWDKAAAAVAAPALSVFDTTAGAAEVEEASAQHQSKPKN